MNHKLNLKKQLVCIYTNNFFSGLRITDAVWVALLAARGFSLWEIGVAESVFHMVSLTFEVPSGMAADLLGRRKTLVSGGVCMVLSNLLMAFAPDLFFICLAMALSALANQQQNRQKNENKIKECQAVTENDLPLAEPG